MTPATPGGLDAPGAPDAPEVTCPASRSSATRSCTRSVVAQTTTEAPQAMNNLAQAIPIPLSDPAPVTTAVRPSRSKAAGRVAVTVSRRLR